ncbi:hypothetical protein CALVIDRAFT_333105 [Calocera viscosa TUFC12733]|uniref:Uncharacterized protein n=1 Tax=Calocera viscosa (strain TUFC12733) TaxID=1330018 RepID=A0A167HQA4_CALVF|nr:hypothetical protein CALVIDRAFT_333105 [Calocera viscosa TUFC12733]
MQRRTLAQTPPRAQEGQQRLMTLRYELEEEHPVHRQVPPDPKADAAREEAEGDHCWRCTGGNAEYALDEEGDVPREATADHVTQDPLTHHQQPPNIADGEMRTQVVAPRIKPTYRESVANSTCKFVLLVGMSSRCTSGRMIAIPWSQMLSAAHTQFLR